MVLADARAIPRAAVAPPRGGGGVPSRGGSGRPQDAPIDIAGWPRLRRASARPPVWPGLRLLFSPRCSSAPRCGQRRPRLRSARWGPESPCRPPSTPRRRGDAIFLSGTHVEDVTIETSGITLTSAPGQEATLRGRLVIWDGANDVVVSTLHLDGINAARAPSPTGARGPGDLQERRRHEREHRDLLHPRLARARLRERRHRYRRQPDPRLRQAPVPEPRSRALSRVRTRHSDHEQRDLRQRRPRDPALPGRGPDADRRQPDRRKRRGNHLLGRRHRTSNDNVVRNNIIANSRDRYNVEYYYSRPSTRGTGNVVTRNCILGGRQGNILGAGVAFVAYDNVVGRRPLRGSTPADLRLAAKPACKS